MSVQRFRLLAYAGANLGMNEGGSEPALEMPYYGCLQRTIENAFMAAVPGEASVAFSRLIARAVESALNAVKDAVEGGRKYAFLVSVVEAVHRAPLSQRAVPVRIPDGDYFFLQAFFKVVGKENRETAEAVLNTALRQMVEAAPDEVWLSRPVQIVGQD